MKTNNIWLIIFISLFLFSCNEKNNKKQNKINKKQNEVNEEKTSSIYTKEQGINIKLFSLSNLSKNQIDFKSLYFFYDNKKRYDTIINNYMYGVFLINEKYKIKHYYDSKAGAFGQGNENCMEKITIQNKIFAFEQLPFFQIEKLYFFEFRKKEYLLLQARNRKMLISNMTYHWILFDTKNLNGITIKTDTKNPHFIGDFNEDKNLDYLYLNVENDTIKFFTFDEKRNHFFNKKNYYLITKRTEKQKKDASKGKPTIGEWLDLKNSNWIFSPLL